MEVIGTVVSNDGDLAILNLSDGAEFHVERREIMHESTKHLPTVNEFKAMFAVGKTLADLGMKMEAFPTTVTVH
jgi:thiamine biosynthesis protein ThiC